MPQAWQYRPCSAVAQELQDKGVAGPLPLAVAGGKACTASMGIGLIEWAGANDGNRNLLASLGNRVPGGSHFLKEVQAAPAHAQALVAALELDVGSFILAAGDAPDRAQIDHHRAVHLGEVCRVQLPAETDADVGTLRLLEPAVS